MNSENTGSRLSGGSQTFSPSYRVARSRVMPEDVSQLQVTSRAQSKLTNERQFDDEPPSSKHTLLAPSPVRVEDTNSPNAGARRSVGVASPTDAPTVNHNRAMRRSVSRVSNVSGDGRSTGTNAHHHNPLPVVSRGNSSSSHAAHEVHTENAAFSHFAMQQTGYLPTFYLHGELSHDHPVGTHLTQYFFGTAPRSFKLTRGHSLWDLLLNSIPRGAGQVCFMNNPWSGVLMVAGLSIGGTTQYSLFGVGGLILSTLFAMWLRVGRGPIRSGLFGYNGILVGYSLPILMYGVNDPHASYTSLLSSVFALVMFSFLAVILTISLGNLMVPHISCPPFTLPFNISAMLYYLCSGSSRNFMLGTAMPYLHGRLDPSVSTDKYWLAWESEGYFDVGGEVVKAIFRGVSQVFLCDYWPSGVIVVIALALCSRISACMAVWGSAIGLFTGMFFGAPKAALFAGLWGYNSVLACIAVGGMFFVMSARTFMLATVCAVLCAVLQGAMQVMLAPTGVATLTMPFCLGTILMVLVQRNLPDIMPVQLQSLTTPEEHLNRARQAAAEAASTINLWKRINGCKERAVHRLILIRRGMILCYPKAEDWNGLPASVVLTAVKKYLRSTGTEHEFPADTVLSIIGSMVDTTGPVPPYDGEMNYDDDDSDHVAINKVVYLHQQPHSGNGGGSGGGNGNVSSDASSVAIHNGGNIQQQSGSNVVVNVRPAPLKRSPSIGTAGTTSPLSGAVITGWVPFHRIFVPDDTSDETRGGPNLVMLALEYVARLHIVSHPGAPVYRHRPLPVWRLQPQYRKALDHLKSQPHSLHHWYHDLGFKLPDVVPIEEGVKKLNGEVLVTGEEDLGEKGLDQFLRFHSKQLHRDPSQRKYHPSDAKPEGTMSPV